MYIGFKNPFWGGFGLIKVLYPWTLKTDRIQDPSPPSLIQTEEASSVSGDAGPRDMFARPCAEQSPRAPNEEAGDASVVAGATVYFGSLGVYGRRAWS